MSKSRILRYLVTVRDASATDVAVTLRLSLPAAGMALLRLTRSGLVAKTFDEERRCLFYALTPKGQARLKFLERRTL